MIEETVEYSHATLVALAESQDNWKEVHRERKGDLDLVYESANQTPENVLRARAIKDSGKIIATKYRTHWMPDNLSVLFDMRKDLLEALKKR